MTHQSEFIEQRDEQIGEQILNAVDTLREQVATGFERVAGYIGRLTASLEQTRLEVTKNLDEVYEILREESQGLLEKLPNPSDWPSQIEDSQTASVVAKMYAKSEALTFGATKRTRKRVGTRNLPNRTSSHFGWEIEEWVKNGGTLELIDIDISEISTHGSYGSTTRQNHIQAALNEEDANIVFRRLPPIVVSRDDLTWTIHDGNTRAMMAAANGIPSLRAYVFITADAQANSLSLRLNDIAIKNTDS